VNVLLVFAHPEPRSFNGTLRDAAVETLEAQGHSVVVSDLYAEGFDAVAGPGDFLERADPDRFDLAAEQAAAAPGRAFAPGLRREIERLFAADFLVLQFPLWWFSVPAILKGWFDRVLAFGLAYDLGRTWDAGVFAGRRAMLSITTGAPAAALAPDGRSGDLERILWPLHAGVLALLGYRVLPPFVGYAVPWIGDEARQRLVDDYRERLRRVETTAPLFFHPHADVGGDHRLRTDVTPATPGQHRGPRMHLPTHGADGDAGGTA